MRTLFERLALQHEGMMDAVGLATELDEPPVVDNVVDPLDEPGRHVAPNRRLPEGPRPGDDGGHEREGVPDRGALPEGPGEDGGPAAAVGENARLLTWDKSLIPFLRIPPRTLPY